MFHGPSEKLEGGKEELITTLIYLNWSPLLYGIHTQFY